MYNTEEQFNGTLSNVKGKFHDSILNAFPSYYNYELRNSQLKFSDRVFKRSTCFVATGSIGFQPLISMTAKGAKLQATMLFPLETRRVAHGNAIIHLSPKFGIII